MNKSVTVIVAGLLITISAMGALMAEKMQVTRVCKDVRVAMDGAIDAVIETGGLTSAKTILTLFKHHNRQKIKLQSFQVHPIKNGGTETYEGDDLQMTVSNKLNPKTGRQTASLQGEVNGESLSILLGCGN